MINEIRRSDDEYYIDNINNSSMLKYFKINKTFGPYTKKSILPFKNKNVYNYDSINFKLLDDENHYTINDNGFRGLENFNDDVEIVAAGCSVTFGMGVPDHGVWPSILESMSNKKVANVSSPGASISTVCNDIIKYCTIFKKPKYIFILFPQINRKTSVYDSRYLHGMDFKWGNKLGDGFLNVVQSTSDMMYDKKLKKIFFIPDGKDNTSLDNLITPHQTIFDSLLSIFALESFCRSNDIKLVWTSWCNKTLLIMEKVIEIKNIFINNFKNYPEIYEDGFEFIKNCDILHDEKLTKEPSWHDGLDYILDVKNNKIKKHSHPGMHYHYHIAEFFNKFI